VKTFPTLYKKSSTGKITEWTIVADAKVGGDAFYEVTFGYTDGKKQSTSVNVDEGKNLGKSNETTPYTQACAEAESKWEKQKDKGYCKNIQSTSIKPLSPMLAHKYDDHKKKVVWPCYWQKKIDGCRNLAYRLPDGTIMLQSRQGKPFKAMVHLAQEIDKILPKDSKLVLDGELYVHGEEFQELIHLIKRDEPCEDSQKIEYHVYDCYDPDNPNMTFTERANTLLTLKFNGKIKLVETGIVNNDKEVWEAHSKATNDGYEGIMLRNALAPYKLGYRSHDLLKVKEFKEEEFEIVGGYQNKGKCEDQCTLICQTKDGTEFGVKPDGDSKQREWYWNNLDKIKGQLLTVKFFSYTTSEHPVPRFPVGKSVRNYE